MRYRSALLLVLFSVAARAESGPVTISLENADQTSAVLLSTMQHELESLMSTSGISIAWKSTSKPEVYSRIAVIRLQGQCRADAPVPYARPSTRFQGEALGQTHVVDGNVLPIADIRCDSVRQFLAPELRAVSPGLREELLGRALSRVMAHELYHILLRTREHGREGIARPAQSIGDLTAPRVSFAPREDRRARGIRCGRG